MGFEVGLDHFEFEQEGFHAFFIETTGVVAVVVFYTGDFFLTFYEVFVVVEVAGVARDTVVVTHVFGFGHFFPADEGFVEFFTVAGADDFYFGVFVIEGFQGGGQRVEGRGRGFLYEQVAVTTVLERVQDQVYGIVEGHHEAGHVGVGDGDDLVGFHLFYPQGDDAAAAGHHVAVTGAADGRSGIGAELTGFGDGYFFHHGFADAHCIDGVAGFVGGQDYDVLNTVRDGGVEDVLGA